MTTTPPVEQEYVEHDGHRLGVQVHPDPDPAAPYLVLFPAMGVPARYYAPFAAAMGSAGCAVAVADLRGTGESRPRPSRSDRYGYPELTGDVAAVLDALAPRLRGRRPILAGHSLGGQLALMHLVTSATPAPAGLVLLACGLPYFRTYRGMSGRFHPMMILGFSQAVGATAAALRVWPGTGFGGRQARGVMRDWAYTARKGRFPVRPGFDPEPGFAAITTPVYAVTVAHDQYTPPVTTAHLCRKLTSAPVEWFHYTDEAAGQRLDHFRWARAAGPLAQQIRTFVDGLG